MKWGICPCVVLLAKIIASMNYDLYPVERLLDSSTQPSASDYKYPVGFDQPNDCFNMWEDGLSRSFYPSDHEEHRQVVGIPTHYQAGLPEHPHNIDYDIASPMSDRETGETGEVSQTHEPKKKGKNKDYLEAGISSSESNQLEADKSGQLLHLYYEPDFQAGDMFDLDKFDAWIKSNQDTTSTPSSFEAMNQEGYPKPYFSTPSSLEERNQEGNPESMFNIQETQPAFTHTQFQVSHSNNIQPTLPVAHQEISGKSNGREDQAQFTMYDDLLSELINIDQLIEVISSQSTPSFQRSFKRKSHDLVEVSSSSQQQTDQSHKRPFQGIRNREFSEDSNTHSNPNSGRNLSGKSSGDEQSNISQSLSTILINTGDQGGGAKFRHMKSISTSLSQIQDIKTPGNIGSINQMTTQHRSPPELRLDNFILCQNMHTGYKSYMENMLQEVSQLDQDDVRVEKQQFDVICKFLNKRGPVGGIVTSRDQRLKNKMNEFKSHQKVWYEYWKENTNLDFRSYQKQVKHENLPEIFPMFLLYVEMFVILFNTWPKGHEQQYFDYTTTMEKAGQFFLMIEEALRNLDQKIEDNWKEKISAIRGCFCNPKNNINQILWHILDLWLKNNHSKIWNELSSKHMESIKSYTKTFLNHMFFFGIDELTEFLKKSMPQFNKDILDLSSKSKQLEPLPSH
ncbi:hypothetical protein PGT21_015633 [Puccinia graminis f. sp. tritici]|uniref:Uncharacterized protein n=1 Tax=Puccinia graminis f. sp. tritici TaxID=56615 RepID=A0A5B0LW81_PUCGR|nr:hypothetical protein PGTUg99_036236 [Puccinia graminis f. sp. tritici]KAA1104232.1 hypothetical protein PGT21_015633 [Puccinia graminis f. sp. tritici]